jgi:Zn-dependent protease with chaperone function
VDFFAQQDLARRNTRLLVVLFLLAVLLLVLLTNVLVAGFLFFGQDYNLYAGSRDGMAGFLSFFSWSRFGAIAVAITATVALMALVKWIELSTGGKAVAEGMGGVRILPQSTDAAERRCLNIVEEMALAANMPVPPVYVLNEERGINAFAAGITPADAVVAVTRGAIEHLKRHELQGVIAHEFSHILNGDIRLNIRLAALLNGITFVGDVGYYLMRQGTRASYSVMERRDQASPSLSVLGAALWILGWLGGLAAGFIKAAISRQKEYLADASAVQYTRSADGIGDALKVIGGYIPGTLVHAARATEMSHIFFGQIKHRLWQVFATHPPLRERIRRVDPAWDGNYIERKPTRYLDASARAEAAAVGVGRAALVAAAMAGALAADSKLDAQADADFAPEFDPGEKDTAVRQEIPLAFVQHSHDPLGAHAIIYALLISDGEPQRQLQLDIVAAAGISGLDTLVNTLQPDVRALGAPRRLPLVEMCLPALKSMSKEQYRLFKHTLVRLIQADQQTHLWEWCLFQLVRHYLDPEFVVVKPSRPRYRKLQQVAAPLQVVLSVLAHHGSGETSEETSASYRAGADNLGFSAQALLPLEQCSVAAFSKAVHTLADCYPLLKPRVLKAMYLAAAQDGELSAEEQEIIASTAAVMDCPLPSPAP